MKLTTFIIALLTSASLIGCASKTKKPEQAATAVKITDHASLIKSKKEMYDSTTVYRFPFEIDNNKRNASLSLDFVVLDKGHCPVTYVPTTVSVNGSLIDTIDFRKLEYKERYKFDIAVSKSLLVSGRNEIEIVTGECSYDIDDMVMNDMKISLQ